MSARRYRTEIAGVVRVGLEFDSEAELEAFLDGRGLALPEVNCTGSGTVVAEAEPRTRGRPSFDSLITEAITALGPELDTCSIFAERARLVLRYLAQTYDADSLPKRRTVEIFLAEQISRGKVRGKSRGK